MSLTAGARIGPYEIVAPLGAGGMGEVYRARDARLKRDVAIKVLPPALAGDRERLARFQREAEVLASLNHPNIAQVHGLEESHGTIALVMELVEGDDLSARIARGAIPLDEALPLARQIADALDAAHERGIIHRDLKPANIKVRDDGTVKVLDFGLAKALDPAAGSHPDLMNSPTMTSPMTQMGMILGTAAYMSPEQARGRMVDRRADIWAFGCVLYEMLTGTRAFDGDTVTDVLAAVVKTEPDWDALPAGVPRAVRTMLRRCLAKDPRQRLRDVADARLEIMEPEIALAAAASPPGPSSRRWVAAMALTVLAAMSAGVAGGVAWWGGRDAAPAPWVGTRLGGPAIAMSPRISPDGQLLAFQAMVEGLSQVAVMKPGTGSWTVLTSDRSQGLLDSLAWSHDGARIYYDRLTDTPGGIYSVPALGGEERLLIENASRPESLPDGSLLLLRRNANRLLQLQRLWPDSGRLEPLPVVVSSIFDGNFVRPIDEDRVAFFGKPLADTDVQDQLYVLTLGTGATKRLGPDLPSADVISMAFRREDRSMLVAIRDGSEFPVLVIPVDGTEARASGQRFFSEPYLETSPDGDLFAALRDRPAEVLRFREGRPDSERLAAGPTLFRGAVGLADGRYLITERLGTTSHVLIAAPGKESTRLVETREDTRDPMTPVGADRVAVVIGSATPPEIAIVAVNSGRILKRLRAPGSVTSLAASPDGAVLYATADGSVSALPVDGGTPRTVGPGDSVTVDPVTGDLIVKLDEAERYRLVRMSPAGGTPEPIAIAGALRLVSRPLMPGAIRNGRLLLPVATVDSWYWFAGVLDLRTGRITKLELDSPTDFHWVTWASDGSVLGSGMAIQSALWKFTREAAR